jgi:superfamily II DNA or RNA helicase
MIRNMDEKIVVIDVNNTTSKISEIRYINDHGTIIQSKIPFELSKKIFDDLSYTPHNAIWSPKFKAGKWKGKIYLGDYKTQEFPTGLYRRVSNVIKNEGYKVLLRDNRIKPEKNENWKIVDRRWDNLEDEFIPRYYQNEAKDIAVKYGRGILSLPTGSGKTTIFTMIIAALQTSPVIVFVPIKTLLYQTKREIEALIESSGQQIEVGIIGDQQVDIKPITVCIVDSALSAFGVRFDEKSQKITEEKEKKKVSPVQIYKEDIKNLIKSAKVVICDESHCAASEKWKATLNLCQSAYYKIGTSATPQRDDGKDMEIEAIFGRILFDISLKDLIEQDHLMNPEIYMLTINHDPDGAVLTREIELLDENGDTYTEEITKWIPKEDWDYDDFYNVIVVHNDEWNSKIAALTEKFNAENLSVLVLVKYIEHGEILEQMIPDSIFLQGNDSTKIRENAIAELKTKERLTLIATSIADMGLDLPNLDVLILAGSGGSDPTKRGKNKKVIQSERLLSWTSGGGVLENSINENEYEIEFGGVIKQRLGRVLRKSKGKTRAIVIDAWFKNRMLNKQSAARKKIFTRLGLKVKIVR